ncbi:hypothetical protein ACFUTX_14275 [Microbacterium sp. NPDC057407]|uniref:hypothetical protein n=1 Tax=Microbacterium sp. NPDC057407 TaxID=3346120 RepID=UPI00366C6E54
MASKKNGRAEDAASVVLFVVIAVVSVGLAIVADLHIALRGVTAVICGVLAAAVTHTLVSRRGRG